MASWNHLCKHDWLKVNSVIMACLKPIPTITTCWYVTPHIINCWKANPKIKACWKALQYYWRINIIRTANRIILQGSSARGTYEWQVLMLERGGIAHVQGLEHCQFYVTNRYENIWECVLLYWSDIETYNMSVEGHNVHLYLY
jgi:hypothetical protein